MTINIAGLRAALPSLSERDQAFAMSLIEQSARRGLSEKQAYWVDRLIQQAAPKPPPPVVNTARIGDLFAKASARLKRPALRLAAGSDTYTVSKAPDTGRNAGHLYVKRNGEYAGKINPAGEFFGSFACTDPAAVASAITAFSADPLGQAEKYGRLTGHCCFCGRGLTDATSVANGYGPVCATNWGLA